MCHQYSLSSELQETSAYFGIEEVAASYRPRYNIVPTYSVPVVSIEQGKRVLDSFRWGMVPFWAPDAINADLHAVKDNEAYYKVVERQRCIIPCNGLYYWRVDRKRKYPVRVVLRTNGIFGIAGLYEIWKSAQKQVHRTCTMVMTRSNAMLAEFNPRMPAILEPEDLGKWLQPDSLEVDYLTRMLKPLQEDRMRMYPVSPAIQYAHLDDASCIAEWDMKQAWVKA
ncbi:SOS response-associated peptidase [Paenibacillus marinisediminis]